ncbi:MAG: hypothetical protein AAB249_07675 [Acidobacteriota bacterium]
MRPLTMSLHHGVARLALPGMALAMPRPGVGAVAAALLLRAPVPPVPVVAPTAGLTPVCLAVLPLAVWAMRLDMRILPRPGRCRLPRRSGGGRPARTGRGMLRTGVMAVR